MNEKVRAGYDRIAEEYARGRDDFKNQSYLERFIEFLRPGSSILDVGCGSGVPVIRFLSEQGYAVFGIDISPRQIELARSNVPQAQFEVLDMQVLGENQYAVAGIVALYAIFHIDRVEHGRLLKILHGFLPRGGPLLITMGGSEWEGSEPDFYGTEMLWSHFGPEHNRELVLEAGFTVMLDEIDTSGGERHQVILATA